MSKPWNERPFGDYANRVDDLLEKRGQPATDAAEWNGAGPAQDDNETPIEYVRYLIRHRKEKSP